MRTPGRGRSGGEDGAGTDPSPAQAPTGLSLVPVLLCQGPLRCCSTPVLMTLCRSRMMRV